MISRLRPPERRSRALPALFLSTLAGAPFLSTCSPLPIHHPGADFQPFLDGFEAAIDPRWHWEIVDPERSAALVDAPVHSGARSLKMSLRQGDKIHNGTRSEAALYHLASWGTEASYRFAFLIPADYAESPDWQLIAQWHDIPDFLAGETWGGYQPLSPPVSFTYKEGALILTMNSPWNSTVRLGEREIVKGIWHEVQLRARWSDGEDGWVEALLDGSPMIGGAGRHYRPTLYSKGGAYMKIGLYRSPDIETENSVYFDSIEVGP